MPVEQSGSAGAHSTQPVALVLAIHKSYRRKPLISNNGYLRVTCFPKGVFLHISPATGNFAASIIL